MFHVKNVLCKNLDVKASGTIYSDVLDTGYEKVGNVEQLIFELWVTTAAVGADGRLAVNVQTSTTEAFSEAIETGIALSGLAAAALGKGKLLEIALPANLKRYVRVKFVTSTAGTAYFSALNVTAAIRNQG